MNAMRDAPEHGRDNPDGIIAGVTEDVTPKPTPPADAELADPHWFREPTRREHWMAAGLFIAFGVFFVLLFFLTAGLWFRWVTLGLGVYSIVHGLGHARQARSARDAAGTDTGE